MTAVSAIAGSFTIDSISRISGLRAAVGKHDDVDLNGVLPANWEKRRARELTAQVLTHFPETSVVWSASDLMALGAVEALGAAGREAGKQVIDGAWAIVLLFDHHHGMDAGTVKVASRLVALTRRNLERYALFVDEERWPALDFSRFSKVRNPAGGDDHLSIDAFLQAA